MTTHDSRQVLRAAALALCVPMIAIAIMFLSPASASSQEESDPVLIEITTPQFTADDRTLNLVGHVRPWEQATLYSKISGYLEWIGVDKGSWVKAGDVIARIDNPEMNLALGSQRADAKAKKAIYDRLSSALINNPDLVSALEVDRALGDHKAAQAELKRLQQLVDYSEIRAPYDGVITDRWVDPGALIQMATSSQSASARIAQIMNFDMVRIAIEVPESDCLKIAEGQTAVISLSDQEGAEYNGHLARFAWAIDPRTRTMSAEVDVPNPDLQLRPGMFVQCALSLSTGDRLRVPSEAIGIENETRFLWVVENGLAKRILVEIAHDDGVFAEITSGLERSAQIIIKGQSNLTPGVTVKIGN